MPAKPFTGIIPRRYEHGRGWVQCAPHQAQQWAGFLKGKHISSRLTKRQAETDLANTVLRKIGPRRMYKLGQRMPKKEQS